MDPFSSQYETLHKLIAQRLPELDDNQLIHTPKQGQEHYSQLNRVLSSSSTNLDKDIEYDYDEKFDLNQLNNTIPINIIKNKWKLAFYDIFIKYQFLPILLSNPQYSNTLKTFLSNVSSIDDLHENIDENNQHFNNLLNKTNIFFISNADKINTKLYLIMYFRQIYTIRRYIMIIHSYLSQTAKVQPQHPSTTLDTFMYNNIISEIFIPLRTKYVNIIKTSTDTKFSKYWFLIHVSKSMGTSVCATQRDVQYRQTVAKGKNCNLPGLDAPIAIQMKVYLPAMILNIFALKKTKQNSSRLNDRNLVKHYQQNLYYAINIIIYFQ